MRAELAGDRRESTFCRRDASLRFSIGCDPVVPVREAFLEAPEPAGTRTIRAETRVRRGSQARGTSELHNLRFRALTASQAWL